MRRDNIIARMLSSIVLEALRQRIARQLKVVVARRKIKAKFVSTIEEVIARKVILCEA